MRFGQTVVRISAEGCEQCGARTAPGWSNEGRLVLIVVAGRHRMVNLPLCAPCAAKRAAGEFAGLTPAHSDRPLEVTLPA